MSDIFRLRDGRRQCCYTAFAQGAVWGILCAVTFVAAFVVFGMFFNLKIFGGVPHG